MDDKYAKKMIIEIGQRMYMKNFVAANDGNISIKVDDNHIWITPTGVSKGFMSEDMLIKMDLNGFIVEGNLKPTSELKMHLMIYKHNKNIKAITHAHPINATCFAIARKPLDQKYLTEAIITLGKIPLAKYATPGTDKLPNSILPYINDYKGVLLANHGVLTWGKDILEAYYRLESVEYCATIAINLKNVGDPIDLVDEEIREIKEVINMR